MIIEGNVSVKAAMLGGKRKVNTVFLDADKHDRDIHFIERKAEELGIPAVKKTRAEIDAMAQGRTHGGVIAQAECRQYQKLEDCITDHAFLVLLEGVEDPFNLGYIMRSLYSAGCDGLIIRPRSWENAESVILKASAGAADYLNVIMEEPVSAVQKCREKGLYVYAAMRKDAAEYYDADFTKPVLICIGGEMRGLSSAVLKQADQNIYIPYANDFRNALNASAAGAVIAFEVFRQRRNTNGAH